MRTPWFADHIRQVHMDFHMPEFPRSAIKNFNAKDFVDNLERGKVNLVAIFSKGHFGNSFYNTQVGHKHSGLEQDFLMETATECRKRGIRTLAYYSMCWDKHAWDENPDWRHEDVDGEQHGDNRSWGGFVCPNSPYLDELALPQFEEIAAGYPVDGFFIDTPFAGGSRSLCYCRHCRDKWRREFGIDMAGGVSDAMRYRLSVKPCETWLAELRSIIDRNNPELVICMNTGSTPNCNKRIKELIDIGVWESQPHAGDYLGHSLSSRFCRNDICDTQIMTVRFYQGWGDLTLKPTPQLITEFAVMIGNGMPTNVGDQVNVDGTLQPAVYETLNEAFGFVEKHESTLKDADTVRHAVILYPVLDEESSFVAGLLREGETAPEVPAYRGAHKLLTESHVQNDTAYSILVEDNLADYPMLVLPEPPAYQPGLHEKLRDYVEQGGTLVAVGRSLINDGKFALEDVFGFQYLEPASFETVHFQPGEALAHATADIPLQVRGSAYKVVPDTAEELAAMVWPMSNHQPPVRAFRSPYPPAAELRSRFPFATVNQFGKGKAVYIAASIFEIYWRTNHHWLRQFTEALLRHVDPSMPYDTDAPSTVEFNLMRRGDDLLLNLINYALGHQGGPGAIAAIERSNPTHNITCRVRCAKPSAVTLEPAGDALDFDYADGVCTFTVPEVEYLTVVRLHRAE